MKGRYKLALIGMLAALLPSMLMAKTINITTKTFNAATLNKIANGDTLSFAGGTYKTTQSLLDLIDSHNVIMTRSSGTVVLDGNATGVQTLEFSGKSGVKINNITLKNIKIILRNCSNSTLDRLIVQDIKSKGKTDHAVALDFGGNNNQVNNCTLNRNVGEGKGIKLGNGTNFIAQNNTFRGKLVGAYVMATSNNSTTNHKIIGGSLQRSFGGEEDHGIYIHNIKNVEVRNVTISGWSTKGTGHGFKIKGATNCNVHHNTINNSGIIVRTAENWKTGNVNIKIESNNINAYGINVYGLKAGEYCVQSSCRIAGNKIKGTIAANNEVPSRFTANGGGVYGAQGSSNYDKLSSALKR